MSIFAEIQIKTKMLHFDTDYMEGAHPKVMERLMETNLEQTPGYGTDDYCSEARCLVRRALGNDSLDVFFLVGGTQTNTTVIDALIHSTQGVLAADTGHINVHEAGAVEAFGHKVLALPSHDGKIHADELKAYIDTFYGDDSWQHMVIPGMLYISFPTEYGTIYSRQELTEIHDICRNAGIPLYIDGARLGYGLMSDACDITLQDLPKLCDVFYIGGTKVGAMFGECVVARPGLLKDFFPQTVKLHGALLAKGRLLGLQFGTLFSTRPETGDILYLDIARHAVRMAMMLKKGFIARGYRPFIDSPTNQQFFTLPNDLIGRLREHATFENWGAPGKTESNVRFVTSWATREESVRKLLSLL